MERKLSLVNSPLQKFRGMTGSSGGHPEMRGRRLGMSLTGRGHIGPRGNSPTQIKKPLIGEESSKKKGKKKARGLWGGILLTRRQNTEGEKYIYLGLGIPTKKKTRAQDLQNLLASSLFPS